VERFRTVRLFGTSVLAATMLATLLGVGPALASGVPPSIPDVSFYTQVNTPYSGELLEEASDPEGDQLTIYSVQVLASHYGQIDTDLQTGSFTYTPQTGWFGTTSLSFWANDGLNRVRATLYIHVNVFPVAADHTVVATEDTALGVTSATMLAGATDGNGDTLSVASVGNATNGTVVLSAGTAAFTPATNVCGSGAGGFDYTVSDGHLGTDTGHVTVDITCVDDAPVCVATASSGNEDAQQAGDVACTDVDTGSLTYSLVAASAHGTAVVHADGSWTYNPTHNYAGPDSFTFRANDGQLDSNAATMSITVQPVEDAPVCASGSSSADEDHAQSGALGCSDPDSGDTLAFSVVAGPAHGELGLDPATGAWAYTPDADYAGPDGFTFRANDGQLDSNTATTSITVVAVNDPPACASPVASSGDEDTLQSGDVACTDVDSPGLTSTLGTGAAHGTAGVAADGGWTYSPDQDYNGPDSFVVHVSDGTDATDVTVNLTVQPVEDAPTVDNVTATVAENSATAQYDVITLGNAADVDEDTVSLDVASVTLEDPAAGSVGAVGNEVSFTPAHAWHGDAVIDFTVEDGAGGTADGTLTITVTADTTGPTVGAPTVAFGTGRVDETAPLAISWSATDANGITAYEVQVSVAGGAFAPVYTGIGTTITKFYAFNKSLVWRVRAEDGANNWSGWISSATRKLLAYQTPGSSSFTSTGSWTNVSSSGSSGTGYRYVSVLGKYAQLKFTGMGVLYVAPKLKAGGYVKVYLDGAYLGRFTNYRASTALGQIIAKKAWATSGAHTIKIVDAQSGRHIALDAFIVLR
jgi:VCBS repeat-containing protein